MSAAMGTVIHGDALRILPTLPSDTYDAIITDPPYSSGGMVRGDRLGATSAKYQRSDSRLLPDFVGDTRDQRSYGYWCTQWLAESWRVTRTGGLAMVFTDWRQLPTTVDALQAGGWVYRGIVVWHKRNGRPVPDRFMNSCEYVVWGSKGTIASPPVKGARYPDGFWEGQPPRQRVHMTQKPEALIGYLMSVLPAGAKVLDPFAGSGAVHKAGRVCGVDVDNIEIDPRWVAHVGDTDDMLPLDE